MAAAIWFGVVMPGFPSALLYVGALTKGEQLDLGTVQLTAGIETAAIAAFGAAFYLENRDAINQELSKLAGDVKNKINSYI